MKPIVIAVLAYTIHSNSPVSDQRLRTDIRIIKQAIQEIFCLCQVDIQDAEADANRELHQEERRLQDVGGCSVECHGDEAASAQNETKRRITH